MSFFKKLMISIFLVFNFLAMVRIHMPLENRFFSSLYQPIDAYLSYFSIYQDWMMFAPDPGKEEVLLTADVEFDDGSKDTYHFPNTTSMGPMEKYIYGEKFRKIISEGIADQENNFMWRDTAKYALRKMKENNFNKIPLKVHLVKHTDLIPRMEEEFRNHALRASFSKKTTFYTYEVLP